MKKSRIIMMTLFSICIGILFSLLLRNNLIVKDNKQLIKDMTQTDYENTISELNKSHADYASHVETCKATIANAITDMGVQTSSDDTVDTMAQNIKNINIKGNKKYLIKDGVIQDGLTFTGARNNSGSAKPTATQQTGYISVSGQGAYTTTFDVSNYSYLGARMDKGTTSGMGTFASSTLVENSITSFTHGSATNPASYLGNLENKTNAYVGIYVYASASQSLKLYDLWLE